LLDEVFEKMNRIIIFRINFFGAELEIGNTIFVSWIVMALLIILALVFTRKLSDSRPGKLQVIAEMLVETVNNLCSGSIGHHGKNYVPYLGTLLLYLGMANIISVFNFHTGASYLSAYKGHQRNRRAGYRQPAGRLILGFPLQRLRRLGKKPDGSDAGPAAVQVVGIRDQAAFAVSAAIWQRRGGFHYHGAFTGFLPPGRRALFRVFRSL